MNRRKLLAMLGSLGSASIAGCIGGGDGNGGDTGSSDGGSSDGNSDGSDSDGSTADVGNGEINYEESFVMEYSFEGGQFGGNQSTTIRVDGENVYLTLDSAMSIEAYFVDGEYYQVTGGQCFKNAENMDLDTPGPVPNPEEDWDPTAGISGEPTGRETIDGEEMLVYETGAAAESPYEGTEITAYVSAETGYLRRVEGKEWQVDYHSWGDVDPIEAPDMECQEVGGGDGGGGYGGGNS
jgi:hypothetical protein